MFYVYEWYIENSGEIIYVGKGNKKRLGQKKRNKLFNELSKRFECKIRILKTFEDEETAFDYEEEYTNNLKKIGQAICNQNFSGNGGTKVGWTQKMRERMSTKNPMKDELQKERMSKLNPMKDEFQKKRMSIENPMKNSEIAKKVGIKHRKPVIINGITYESGITAAKEFNVTPTTIYHWCKNGINKYKYICKYDNQQPTSGN